MPYTHGLLFSRLLPARIIYTRWRKEARLLCKRPYTSSLNFPEDEIFRASCYVIALDTCTLWTRARIFSMHREFPRFRFLFSSLPLPSRVYNLYASAQDSVGIQDICRFMLIAAYGKATVGELAIRRPVCKSSAPLHCTGKAAREKYLARLGLSVDFEKTLGFFWLLCIERSFSSEPIEIRSGFILEVSSYTFVIYRFLNVLIHLINPCI